MTAAIKKQLAIAQRQSIKTMRARLMSMAEEWSNLDSYNAHLLEEAAEKLLDVHADLLDTVEDE